MPKNSRKRANKDFTINLDTRVDVRDCQKLQENLFRVLRIVRDQEKKGNMEVHKVTVENFPPGINKLHLEEVEVVYLESSNMPLKDFTIRVTVDAALNAWTTMGLAQPSD